MNKFTPRELQGLHATSSRLAASHACAFWFGERPDRNSAADLLFGTASLLLMQGRYLAVTCHHVVEGFREYSRKWPGSMAGIGGLSIDLETCLIDSDRNLDLAILDISGHVHLGALEASRFHEPACWPSASVAVGDFVFFAGYPGAWVEQPAKSHLRFYSMTAESEVHSVGESYFYVRLELDKCDLGNNERQFEGLGGMSGAPVFTWRTLHAELVGFIVEYQASLDLLLIRRASVLDGTGAILR